jgi:flagellar M-ring protein FliF
MQRQAQKSSSSAIAAGGQSTIAPVGGKQVGSTTAKQGPGSERLDEVVNYEINKVVSKTVMPVGDVKKLSVAVLLDGPYVKNDKGVEEFQPRSKKELTDLEELVKKAAGFDTKRGDQVVITNVPFNKGEFDAGTTGKESWPEKVTAFYPVIKYLVMLAALILVAIFVLQPVIKMLLVRGKTPEFASREALSSPAGELEGMASPLAIGEKSTVALNETDLVRQMASADARRFAELLRLWIR